MAHAQRLSQLTDELITSITAYSPSNNAQAFKHCQSLAQRHIRSTHRFARTNQFSVQSSLSGLVEKFAVRNHDDVAEALDTSLQKLGPITGAKFRPDVLSLLLLLSNRPVENATNTLDQLEKEKGLMQDRENAKQAESVNWKEILAEESLEGQGGIWDDIDFGAHTSENEDEPLSLRSGSHSSRSSTPSTGIPNALQQNLVPEQLQSMIVEPDYEALEKLLVSQIPLEVYAGRTNRRPVPEIVVIRESIHMLLGLSSPFFVRNSRTGKFCPLDDFCLEDCSVSVCMSILTRLARIGVKVKELRSYAAIEQSQRLLQSFTASIADTVRDFDSHIATLEKRLVAPTCPEVVSLMCLDAEVFEHSTFLLGLWRLISTKGQMFKQMPYTLLDALHDEACDAKAVGDSLAFQKWGEMFVTCLNAYLKLVRSWMEEGELDYQNDDLPIDIHEGHMHLNTFWRERFLLKVDGGNEDAHRQSKEQKYAAPTFLWKFLSDILASGKSMAFMRELGISGTLADSGTGASENQDRVLSLASICNTSSDRTISLVPFSTLLARSLMEWIQSSHRLTTAPLRDFLLYRCGNGGIMRLLRASLLIYLSENGALFADVASEIFSCILSNDESIDEGDKNNGERARYLLEDTVRDLLGQFGNGIDVGAVTVHLESTSVGDKDRQATDRQDGSEVEKLQEVRLDYHYNRALHNILPPNQFQATLQSIHTTLLQLHHASSLLNVTRSRPNDNQENSPNTLQRLKLQLRHRISHTLFTLQTYFTQSVIHPATLHLHSALKTSSTVDDLIDICEAFIKRLGIGCFVSSMFSSTTSSQHHARHRSKPQNTSHSHVINRCIFKMCELAVSFADVIAAEVAGDARDKDRRARERTLRQLKKLRERHVELVMMLMGEVGRLLREGEGGGDGKDLDENARMACEALVERLEGLV